MTAPKALKSSSFSQEDRNQKVFTPQCLVDCILQVWPYIALDPCPATDDRGVIDMTAPVSQAAQAFCSDGLADPWVDGTFVNSPWDPLKPWLVKAIAHEHLELMILAPVRPHRYGGIWCQAAETARKVAWLKPIKFHGQKNQCPLPCVMLYFGSRSGEFAQAFAPVSHHVGVFV